MNNQNDSNEQSKRLERMKETNEMQNAKAVSNFERVT